MGKKRVSESCSVTWTSEACEMNFEDSACPIGWSPAGDSVCEPPFSLDGACAATEKLAGVVDKRELVARCGSAAAYPCMDTCIQDYAQACPQDWLSIDGYCVAPRRYQGPCLSFQNFVGLVDEDKRSWSKACQARFPCQPESSEEAIACEPARSCPDDWILIGDTIEYCQAGSDYKGPCRPAMALTEIKRIGTRRFAKACSVVWSGCAPVVRPKIVQPDSGDFSSKSAAVAGPIADDGRLFVIS